METKLRRMIVSCFKLNGFSLPPDSAAYIVEIFKPIEQQQHNLWLDRIIDKIQKLNLTSNLLKKDQLVAIIKELGKGEAQSLSDYLHFISAYEIPILDYDAERKAFFLRISKGNIISDAEEKQNVYRHRYNVLKQRTLHHDLFTPPVPGAPWDKQKENYSLKAVEYLLGSTAKLGDLVVLGMISQMKEGKYFLEDATGSVELDLSETKFHTGLYTESCFVLAEGNYDCKVFNVKAMGLPPPETAQVTRIYHGNTNFFGAPTTTTSKDRLEFIEDQNGEANILFFSDLHIDKLEVLNQLKVLFEGFSESPPLMFVFMGNFLSDNYGSKSAMKLKMAFKDVADIISSYPSIQRESIFVIIPGPNDPGFVNILPRPAFADCMTSYLKDALPNCVFGTNPFRIKYCSKEIVIFRDDIISKMCRNSLYFPTEGDVPTHFVKTVVGQSCLCPLPIHMCPVYWNYDQALSLYPLPDIVVIADKYDPYTVKLMDCIFTNPGSFVKTDYSFQVYLPSKKQLDDCQLPTYDSTVV